MTLDEAIKQCKEKAEGLRRKAINITPADPYYEDYCDCLECAEEQEQLAEWLTQLKRLKDAYESDYQIDDLIQVCLDIWG